MEQWKDDISINPAGNMVGGICLVEKVRRSGHDVCDLPVSKWLREQGWKLSPETSELTCLPRCSDQEGGLQAEDALSGCFNLPVTYPPEPGSRLPLSVHCLTPARRCRAGYHISLGGRVSGKVC